MVALLLRLSPWMAAARNSRLSCTLSWSHMRLVEQKMMMRLPGGLERRICPPPAATYNMLNHITDGN